MDRLVSSRHSKKYFALKEVIKIMIGFITLPHEETKNECRFDSMRNHLNINPNFVHNPAHETENDPRIRHARLVWNPVDKSYSKQKTAHQTH